MEKRVIVAVVLSFLVLYGYQTVFMPKPPARPAQSQAAAGQGGGTGAAAGRTGGGQAAPAPPTGVATAVDHSQPARPAPAGTERRRRCWRYRRARRAGRTPTRF